MLGVAKIGGETVTRERYRKFTREGMYGEVADSDFGISPAMAVAAGPLLGLAYVLFLPFIGIGMLILTAARRIFGGLLQSAQRNAVFTWKPSEAYLAGKKGRPRRTISKKEEEKKE